MPDSLRFGRGGIRCPGSRGSGKEGTTIMGTNTDDSTPGMQHQDEPAMQHQDDPDMQHQDPDGQS